jgi:hypothetical protein
LPPDNTWLSELAAKARALITTNDLDEIRAGLADIAAALEARAAADAKLAA